MLQHSVTAQKVVQLPLTFFKVTFWRIKLQKGRQKWPEKMDALCNITLRGGGANEKLATQLSLHLKASYPDNQGKRD